MYNLERRLNKKEQMAVTEFEELLLKRFPKRISRLILFGSKARRTSTCSSDVDILVVVRNNGKRISQEIAILTHKPIAKYMVDISPIIVEEKFFKNWSPLLEHIQREGITVWTNKKVRKNI